MKKLILFLIIILAPLGVAGQCVDTPDDPCVAIKQSELNKATAAIKELVAARDVIAKFTAERAFTDAERKAAQVLIQSYDSLLATKDKMILEYERIQGFYKQVVDFQQQIITNLERQLNRPTTAWQKFIKTVGRIVVFAAGVYIGRL